MVEKWEGIRDGILSAISEETSHFLEDHPEIGSIVEDRSKRLARLARAYVLAETDTIRRGIESDMGIVRQSLQNELSAIAIEASAEAKAAFARTAQTVFTTLIKTLPGLLG